MWLFLLFLAVPLVEIALFVQVGGAIGLWWTLAIVIATAIAGTFLVRTQGLQTVQNLRTSLNDLRDPTEHLVHGAMILFAGALLLTPGFFTDSVGLALLLPPVRTAIYDFLRRRIEIQRFEVGRGPGARRPGAGGPTVIEGEFEEVEPPRRPGQGPSGWTRH